MYDPEEVRERLKLGDMPDDFVPGANISPGQNIPVVIDPVTRNVQLFRWGLVPGWAKDPRIGYKMINARAETVAEKPSFRVSFQRRRCLIPADGFYEWKLDNGRKYPFLFTLVDRVPFTFAGLWDTWRGQEGAVINSCTIITTTPNSLVAQYHDRMPVILDEISRWKWLENLPAENLKALLVPYDAEKMAAPVRLDRL